MFDRSKKKLLAYAYRKKREFVIETRRRYFRGGMKLFARKQDAKYKTLYRVKQRQAIYFSVGYFFVATCTALIITQHIDTASEQLVSGFIFNSAAVIGGTLAIIFTFHTLLVTFALDQYPPEFYKLSGYERRLDAIYVGLALLTISQFSIGLLYNGDEVWPKHVIVLLAILILSSAFFLLFAALALVRSRLDPLAGIARINNRAIKSLDNSAKFSKKYVDLLLRNPDITEREKQLIYYQPYFHLHRSYDELNRFLGYLHNYHDKLVAEHETTAALLVLDSIGALITKFIEVNKKSLMPMQSSNPLVATTIAEKFFDTNYERLLPKAKRYIDSGDVQGLNKITEIWQKIARATVTIEYNGIIRDNPEFERCLIYFGMVNKHAIASKNMEAVFEFTKVYATFGELTVVHGYQREMGQIYKAIAALQLWGAKNGEDVVQSQAAWALSHIAGKIIDKAEFHKAELDGFVQAVSSATILYLATVPDNPATTGMDELQKPLIYLANALLGKLKQASNFANPARDDEQRKILQLLDHIYDLIRRVCDSQPIVDRLATIRLTDVIEALYGNLLPCIDKRPWQPNAQQLQRELVSFAHLYGWFANKLTTVRANYFDTSTQSIGLIGIRAAEAGKYDITQACISSIKHIALGLLVEKGNSSVYDAPREAANIAYIALYALYKGEMNTVAHAKKELQDFNQKYLAAVYPNGFAALSPRMFSQQPYPNQVYFEIKEYLARLEDTNSSVYGADLVQRMESRIITMEIPEEMSIALRKYLSKK